jgi:hypothetical protein
MKKLFLLLLCLASTALSPLSAQPRALPEAAAAPASKPLTKFDLDFPGGTPAQLIAAIEQAMHHPVNAIIPDEYAAWKLPAMKMSSVDASQFFRALAQAGQTRELVQSVNGITGSNQYTYGFRTAESIPTDDTVWFFYLDGQRYLTPKISRFYLLSPYLSSGLSVEDITTAIQTGWKMRGDATTPALSYHKETKLLIAVGDPAGLDVIDSVLRALDAARVKPAPGGGDAKTKP